jgi:hypothetical protein
MGVIGERGDPRDRIANQLPIRHRRTEMKALFNMTNRELAEYLRAVETADEVDTGELVLVENEIAGRLNLSLDETEQGLTQAAADAITAFCRKEGVT